MSVTKAEIATRICERVPGSKNEAARIVDAIFDIIKDRAVHSENVKITGFGTFVLKTKRPHKGRNPQTGEMITIIGRKVLTFKASKNMAERLNARMPEPS
jgi:integration host factor subunit alpha